MKGFLGWTALATLPVALLALVPAARAHVYAQSPARVQLLPLASRVDYADGAFVVTVRVSGIDHHGIIEYDENRDTVPDREEESEGLGAYEVVLAFDPALLRVAEVEAGAFLRSTGRSTQCLERVPEAGQHAAGCVSLGAAPGPQGSGTLATLTLEPVANGTSFLGLTAVLAGPLGDTIEATVDGGIVEVYGGPEPEPDGGQNDRPTGPEGPPTVIGGGNPGDVAPPEGDRRPGARGDGARDEGDASVPSAGTGYARSDARARAFVLGAALAGVGIALLGASRLAARRDRR